MGKRRAGAPKGSINALGKRGEVLTRLAKRPEEYKPLAELTDDDYQFLSVQVGDQDAKAAEDVRWAAKYRFFHPADIDPATVPSRAAVTLLQIAQQDPGKFIEQWSKLLPSRQQIDMQEKFSDDGREALDKLQAVILDAQGSQGVHGEPGVPAADSPGVGA